MQRLAEIGHRRQALRQELAELDREEADIRQTLASVAAIDPAIIALIAESTTQHGCAAAQQQLEAADEGVRRDMLAATLADVHSLAAQTYGALFVQKLLETSSEEDHTRFIYALNTGSTFTDVACTTPGTRVLQRFMELLRSPDAQNTFAAMVAERIVKLSNDANACHIVQRALTPRFAMFVEKEVVVKALVANCVAIATNKQGCCVLQRAIDWLPDAARQSVIDAVIANELELVSDAFGNYVVQHLLDRKDDALLKRTIQPLLHNVAGLSCNKFGSNVIEKCVRVATTNLRQLLVDELTDPSVLPRLLQDSYANYVIQTAISSGSEDQFQQMHAAIRPSFATLKNSPYGIRIEAKIQRRLKDNARARQRQTKRRGQEGASAPASFSMQRPVSAAGMTVTMPTVAVMGGGQGFMQPGPSQQPAIPFAFRQ